MAMASDAPAGPFFGTFIEHWPADLCALSMPHLGHALTRADATRIASREDAVGPADPRGFSPALASWLAQALAQLPGGAFLRLGGRSFVTQGRPPQPVHTAQQALELLAAPGERAARMARRCLLSGRQVWLFARQWRPMQADEEFRLVMRQRTLVAASQLHHRVAFPQAHERAPDIAGRITSLARQLGAALHLPDVVADVWIPRDKAHPGELIELNPLMAATGQALLDTAVTGQHAQALHLRQRDGSTLKVPLCR